MTASGGRRPGLRRRTGSVLTALLVATTLVMIDLPAGANDDEWTPEESTEELWSHVRGTPAASVDGKRPVVRPEEFRSFRLDRAGLETALAEAPPELAAAAPSARSARPATAPEPVELALPKPGGGFEVFAVELAPIMEAGLAAKHPDIATFAGRSVENPAVTVRADITPLGFHASVRGPGGAWYVEPYYHLDQSLYASYYAADVTENPHGVFVEKEDEGSADVEEQLGDLLDSAQAAQVDGPNVLLREYRLALLSDPTYANYFGGPANVIAAKVTMMNRVNQIYEDESAIRMLLIEDTEKINLDTPADMTGANGPCGSAPCFTPAQASGCGGGTLGRNRIVIGQLIGASNYDVGHIIFGLAGGGVATLNSVGGNAKAQGCTGLPNPVGDFFAVDYVAHELGHQFGSNHTFNGNQLNCSGGNRSSANSVEPGSGSSIMAYAGICRQDNLQPHTDPYWSQRSYQVINAFVTSDRAAINEVQTVSLRNFDTNGEFFQLRFDRSLTGPIRRGTNYTTADIKAALEGLPSWPAGAVATVAAWGGTGALNDFGFQVTFSGTLAATNVAPLLEVQAPGDVSGFAGETAKGGPVDNQGFVVTDTGNRAPVVDPLTSYTIPYRTPFALTGNATDADGDTVTYMWEQNDIGVTAVALVNPNKTSGPLFRQFGTALDMSRYDPREYDNPGLNAVTTDPTRVFPDMAQILDGNTNARSGDCPDAPAPPPPTSGGSNVPPRLIDCYSEFLPTAVYAGPMNFRLTARDGNPGAGGVGSADTVISLAPGSGPFLVTSQAEEGVLYGGSTQTVTWDVAGTDQAPIGTSQVKISLSDDGGYTYPYVLAETANDGSAEVSIPNVGIPSARIKVEAIGNVFFAVNDAPLSVNAVPVVTNDAPANLSVQYSDALSPQVTVSATDPDSPGSALTATAEGLPAGVTIAVATTSPGTDVPGTRTWTVGGTVTAAPGTYPVTVTVDDGTGGTGTTSFTIVVTPEDAAITPIGDTLIYAAPGSSTATVALRSTLRDSAIVPGSGDTLAGDIGTATVTFSAGGSTLCGPVAVGSIDGGTTTGSGTCTASLAPGTYTVQAAAGGNYTGSATWQLRVLAADGGRVTGSGSVTASSSAGSFAADPGSAVTASVSAQYTPNSSTLTGDVTVQTVSGGRTYEVRSTSLDALGVTRLTPAGALCTARPSQTCQGVAAVRTTASVVDVATGDTVATGLELRITFVDRGAPGRTDTLGVTVWDGSTLVHSSGWNGTSTVEQALTGGNLNVQ